jgi:hypothetical protein
MSKWQFPELHFNTSGIVATNTRLRGLTRYLSDNSSAQVIISLIIPNEINAWNLLSFAYVLAHEVVCHAYQKVGLPAAADFERPEDCPFTEGWMDATSFNLLRDFLTDPPETVPSIIQLVPDEILDSSKALFHGRYQKDFDRHVAFRENGLSVYKNFAKFVRLYSDQFSGNDLIDSGTVIIRTMARISFLINAMADDDEAENFILYCGVILGYSAGVPGYFNRCRALFEVIEPFLHHRNLARLLRELNRVATPFMSR